MTDTQVAASREVLLGKVNVPRAYELLRTSSDSIGGGRAFTCKAIRTPELPFCNGRLTVKHSMFVDARTTFRVWQINNRPLGIFVDPPRPYC